MKTAPQRWKLKALFSNTFINLWNIRLKLRAEAPFMQLKLNVTLPPMQVSWKYHSYHSTLFNVWSYQKYENKCMLRTVDQDICAGNRSVHEIKRSGNQKRESMKKNIQDHNPWINLLLLHCKQRNGLFLLILHGAWGD